MSQGRLPRLERYVAAVGGLDAFPSALAKGALVRNLLEDEPLQEILPALPEPLRRLAAEQPVGSEWIPEAHFDALLLAVADARGLTEAELLTWTRQRNLRLFSSPAYRILMAVISPAQLIRFAGARWSNWHRGTTLEVDGIADDGLRFSLRYPRGLFDGTMLRVYGEAFTAALVMANAKDPSVAVTAEQPGLARYQASWS